MKRTPFLAASVLLLAGGVLPAQPDQNSDMAFLAGIGPSHTQVLTGPTLRVTTDNNAGFLMSIGRQLDRTRAGVWWFEFTTAFLGGTGTAVGDGVSTRSHSSSLLLPAIRLQVSPHSRLQFYGLAGGGGGGTWKHTAATSTSGVYLSGDFGWRLVGEVGMGLDIRLSRALSLRTEIRDFITGQGLMGSDGRHHPLILGGIAFHF